MARKLDTISEELQFMLVALLEGDALDLVMRTPSATEDGTGFDSLRRIQAAYDAGGECLAPILLQQILSWNAEVNASFRRSLEVWDVWSLEVLEFGCARSDEHPLYKLEERDALPEPLARARQRRSHPKNNPDN